MTETQLRFLRAIAERLPIDRVAELYVFPPMRQGALETGIAIVAAVREVAPDLEAILAAAPEVAAEATPHDADEASAAAMGDASPAVASSGVPRGQACDPTEDASRDVEEALPADAPRTADVQAAADATADVPANVADADASSAAASSAAASAVAIATARAPRERHTVYTARYRLALKGPERGRWELNVVEEADAPLLTVEMVVRGVQQRAGEGAEPERLEPAALRELLGAPAS